MLIRMDETDRKILRLLMADAATPIAQIAHRVNLSQTPAWNRIRRMEADGTIKGRVAVVDPARVGVPVTVFVEVEAARHDAEATRCFHEVVAEMPEAMELYRVAGDADYLLKLQVADAPGYDAVYRRLVERLPAKRVSARFALETLLARTVLPI